MGMGWGIDGGGAGGRKLQEHPTKSKKGLQTPICSHTPGDPSGVGGFLEFSLKVTGSAMKWRWTLRSEPEANHGERV